MDRRAIDGLTGLGTVAAGMDVPVILHYHIFKNAGTSVDEILAANFGDRWRNHDTDDPAGSVLVDEVEAILDFEPHLAALSSHQMRPPLPDRAVIPFVLLRHPLDRIRSIYRFDRRRGPVTPAAEIAARHADFADYLRAMFERRPHVVANAQAWLLTDAWDPATGRRAPVGEDAHIERAHAFLESVQQRGVIGLVESYEESWQHMAPLLTEYHPHFSVDTSARHNSDTGRSTLLEERLAEMRAELGDILFEELVDRNRADLELHAWVSDLYVQA